MSQLRTLAQLVRLPNVFTALADICLGWLALGMPGEQWPAFLLLLLASAFLYSSGMVWNDFFDLEQDRRERPFRPIPSGRIGRRSAARLAAGLMALGLIAAFGASVQSAILAGVLAVMILLYDGWLKRTWAGPLGMGMCRFLNVLLGLTATGYWALHWGWHLALVVGIYIVGVTWFARTEARDSSKVALTGAAVVMLLGLLLALPVPLWFPPGTSSPLFVYLLVGLGFYVGLPVCRAIAQPKAHPVQMAVRRAIFGLIGLDAVLATGAVGNEGLLILLLLVPTMYLGRWVYST